MRCGEGRELALRSSMPGLVAFEKSSPLLTLKRAETVSYWAQDNSEERRLYRRARGAQWGRAWK